MTRAFSFNDTPNRIRKTISSVFRSPFQSSSSNSHYGTHHPYQQTLGSCFGSLILIHKELYNGLSITHRTSAIESSGKLSVSSTHTDTNRDETQAYAHTQVDITRLFNSQRVNVDSKRPRGCQPAKTADLLDHKRSEPVFIGYERWNEWPNDVQFSPLFRRLHQRGSYHATAWYCCSFTHGSLQTGWRCKGSYIITLISSYFHF